MNPHYALHALSLAVIGCLIWKWPTQEVAPVSAKSAEKPALPGAQKGVSTVGTKEKIAVGAKAKAPGKALSEVDRILEETGPGSESVPEHELKKFARIMKAFTHFEYEIRGFPPEKVDRLEAVKMAMSKIDEEQDWHTNEEVDITDEMLEKLSPEDRAAAEKLKLLIAEKQRLEAEHPDRDPKTKEIMTQVVFAVIDRDEQTMNKSLETLSHIAKEVIEIKAALKSANDTERDTLFAKWEKLKAGAALELDALPPKKLNIADHINPESANWRRSMSLDTLNPFEGPNAFNAPETSNVVDVAEPERVQHN